MILNIRWPHRHAWKVQPFTVTEHGADFVCTKCLNIDYYAWQTTLEVTYAEIYLTAKQSGVLLKKVGLL